MNLAIFDLDNTLLNGDSDYNWGIYLVKRGFLDEKKYKAQNQKFFEEYQAGKLDIFAFAEFQFQFLKNNTRQFLNDVRSDYIEEIIKPMILKKAVDLVRQHENSGDRLLIITATNSFITRPIGKLFGIDEVIGTDPEEYLGEFTGKVKGMPSYKEGKVSRLFDWLEGKNLKIEDFDKTFFYSDSHNDLALLEEVTNPIVVNGDKILLEKAQENNWPILNLR
ncbi:MAG: HAD family hydrolase [Nitrosomonadales bacterium]|jgi:HAD superfamily hydrolase (TIGR01490 family)|nr:HAD family hydrolase [Nitrosomonadales bacterium]MBT3917893.1 HAD family hydrolase [Nitrosomonadales bacterium]MBT4183202.1 HAD family hydrolase [Nitrosomonadales bacterium]MBT4570611.1 HAD family hydrolase [Nitrosomonadales bacterium]MBT4759097.1 HAD family hydrolase [Nitrosomonadales bacterium]